MDLSNPSTFPSCDMAWLDSSNNVFVDSSMFRRFIGILFRSTTHENLKAMYKAYIRENHGPDTIKGKSKLVNIKKFIDKYIRVLGPLSSETDIREYLQRDNQVMINFRAQDPDLLLLKRRIQTAYWYVETKSVDDKSELNYDDAITAIPEDLPDGVECSTCYCTLDLYVTGILCDNQMRELENGRPVTHAICKSCLIGYITTTFSESSTLRDPNTPKCVTCDSYYGGRSINNYIPKVLMHTLTSRYTEKLIESTAVMGADGTDLATRCPDCRTKFIVEKGGGINITCANCEFRFCKFCQRKSHPIEIECTPCEWDKYFIDARPCPNCKSLCDKDDGCAHVTCSACNYQWNFCCGTKGHRDHDYYTCPYTELPPYNSDIMILWRQLGLDVTYSNEVNITLLTDYFEKNTHLRPPVKCRVDNQFRKDNLIFESDSRAPNVLPTPQYFFIHPQRPGREELVMIQDNAIG
jgi:hypothetical protein